MNKDIPAFVRGNRKLGPNPNGDKLLILEEKYKEKFGDTSDIWNATLSITFEEFLSTIQKCIDTGKRFEYYYPCDKDVIY